VIKSKRVKCVAGMVKMRNMYKAVVRKTRKERAFGKPNCRWDEI
jgi:hypothetical protein